MLVNFFLTYTSGVASIMQISRALGELRSSLVSYIVSYLTLSSVLGIELVLDSGPGSLSILFIV